MKLSDFGAAFHYGAGTKDGVRYERMEQRAYGLLLEELLARHDGTAPHLLSPVRAAAARPLRSATRRQAPPPPR